jgi:hypothetical protein
MSTSPTVPNFQTPFCLRTNTGIVLNLVNKFEPCRKTFPQICGITKFSNNSVIYLPRKKNGLINWEQWSFYIYSEVVA